MKKLFLHIGLRKTGTSGIQAMLARSGEYLGSCGLEFPILPNSQEKKGKVWNSPFRHNCVAARYADYNTVFDKLTNEETKSFWGNLSQNSLDSIISGESFSRQIDFSSLARDLESFETEVIVYIRRQDKLIESLYNQRNKLLAQRGDSSVIHEQFLTEQELLSFMNRPDHKRGLNFIDLLNRIETSLKPHKLHVRKFDRNCLAGGDVTADFCEILGIDVARMTAPSEEANRSIGNEILKSWKKVALENSRVEADEFIWEVNRERSEGVDYSGDYRLFSNRVRAQVLEQFREHNAALLERYGVDLGSGN
ncbi:hypothetical protein [Rhodobacteraceae bacterium W635]|uniref:hypothetical protein n=1 Tax=Nioella halotolerans TaxID=2303578 RepID=UPI0011C1A887